MSKSLYKAVYIIALVMFAACGGGTVGTGGGREYSGTVLDKSSQPVANATVSLPQSGESTLTDTNGNFSINAKKPTDTETFTITIDDIETTTTIENIPEKETIAVLFVVDPATNSIEGTVVVDDNSENETPDVELPGDDDDEETPVDNDPKNQTLRAVVSLDKNAALVALPSSPTSFQELSAISAFSIFFEVFNSSADYSATTTLYFFRTSETSWEYRLYIDEIEIPNGISRRPYLLASGPLDFAVDGTLQGGTKRQRIELELAVQESVIVVDLSVNATLASPDPEVESPQPKATVAIDLNATLAESTPFTTVPTAATFSSLSGNASSFTQTEVFDLEGKPHSIFFFFYRETDNLWQLIVAEVTDGNVLVLSKLRFDFFLSQTNPLQFSRSTNLTVNWASSPFPQSISLIADATILNTSNSFNINVQ